MKHNKYLSILSVASLMAMLVAGCQKDSVVLYADISSFGDNSKVAIDAAVWPEFEEGDKICVNQKGSLINGGDPEITTGGRSHIPLTVEHADHYYAVYPAEYVTSVSGSTFELKLPRVQEYHVNSDGKQIVKVPMGAKDDGNKHLQFTNLGSLLAVTITNEMLQSALPTCVIDSIQVIASQGKLCGNALVTDVTKDNRDIRVLSGSNTVSLSGPGNTSLGVEIATTNTGTSGSEKTAVTSKTFYISVPHISDEYDNRYTVRVYVGDENFCISFDKTQANAYSGCIPTGYYAKVPFVLNGQPIKIPRNIDGLYSIGVVPNSNAISGMDTIKVDFSHKGNLQAYVNALGQPIEWRFAPHQWDLIQNSDDAATNFYIGSRAGWMDLFGHPVNSNVTDTAPNPAPLYNTTTNNWGISLSSTATDYQGAFVDWGNIPGVIEAEGYDWFTMSAEQWAFLMGYDGTDKSRQNATSKWNGGNPPTSKGGEEKGAVLVHGVYGIVFLPDKWSDAGSLAGLTTLATSNTTVKIDGGRTTRTVTMNVYTPKTSYTDAEWDLMERAGAIFLPTGYQRCYTNPKGDITVTTPFAMPTGMSATFYANGGIYATSNPDNPGHPIHNHNHGASGPAMGVSVRLANNPIAIHHDMDGNTDAIAYSIYVNRMTPRNTSGAKRRR